MRTRPNGAHVLRRPPGPRCVLLWDNWMLVTQLPLRALILPTLSPTVVGAVRALYAIGKAYDPEVQSITVSTVVVLGSLGVRPWARRASQ